MGLILAGGRSRRFGSAKSDAVLCDAPLSAWVRRRLAPQVAGLLANVNGPVPASLSDLPVVADERDGFEGPLVGLLSGLRWLAETRLDIQWCASVSVDAPFLPVDLVARLSAAATDGHPAFATTAGRPHPVIGLWPVSAVTVLQHYLAGDRRDVMGFVHESKAIAVDFAASPFDPFFNVNTRADLRMAERLCREYGLSPDVSFPDRGRHG